MTHANGMRSPVSHLLSLFRQHFRGALFSESHYVRASDYLLQQKMSFLGGGTYCESKTINPCPTKVNKLILFSSTIV